MKYDQVAFLGGWSFLTTADFFCRYIVNGVTTYYPSRSYQVTNNIVTKYYGSYAMRTGSTLYYLLSDHLNSTSMTLNASGQVVSELCYKAFGETRYTNGNTPTDYRYTSQRQQREIGLYFYNARFYDPALGRFTSPDTIVPGAGNIKAFDRYAYVQNNPMNFNDPSGHSQCDYIPGGTAHDQCSKSIGEPTQSNNVKLNEFINSPIDPKHIDGVQWFGGTWNAHELMASSSDIYKYCHDFHCGLDLLAAWDTPVTAGIYGQVSYAGCSSGNYEGPCKVQVQVGDYVITYGHLSGLPSVKRYDPVYPSTVLGGVGTNSKDPNNPDFPAQGANFDHIHLEIRGPGGWSGGPSVNPLLWMSDMDVAVLVDIAKEQTTNPTMSLFYDGTKSYYYPPPAFLMPDFIRRTIENNSYFPK